MAEPHAALDRWLRRLDDSGIVRRMPSPHTAEWPSRYPAPLDPADVPEHLRSNTLVQALLEMSLTDAAACEASARSDAADDAETVALLLADAR